MINNDQIDYFKLIPRYLSGNAGIREVKMLEDWVMASEENKRQFIAFRQAWFLSGIGINQKSFDTVAEWNAFAKEIKTGNPVKIKHLPVKPKFGFSYITRYAAAIIIILISSIGLYQYFNKSINKSIVSQNTIKTGKLPDGSLVTLNHNSEISYPKSKDTETRKVELRGEAFFDVKRDSNHAFMVYADNLTIEVLGTEFYIDARQDQSQINVIVRSGSVSVKSETEKIVLGTNEMAIYDRDSRILLKSLNTDINYMAWKTGILVFESTDLDRVVYDLNKKFNSNVRIGNPSLKSCKITATFDNKSLESIIKIIEKTLKIKSIIKDGETILTGDSCN